LAKRGSPPERYELTLKDGLPILVVGHLKGGVGKTTVAANLAAYYADQGESVLAIDLDFQGSLSSMVLPDDRRRPTNDELSRASQIIDGKRDPAWVIANAWPMRNDLKLFAIPAFYDLARTENRLMVEWLIKDQPGDMPYSLAKLLLSRRVQSEYKRIIVDAPPRLTTACIQALCTGTHLLIPTIMDKLSTEAVTTFLNEVETLKNAGLCPHLKYAGIVGTMLNRQAKAHEPVARSLRDQIQEAGIAIDLLDEKTWIPDLIAINRTAGDSLAYFAATPAEDRRKVQEAFRNLGDEVAERMKRR
jgi:cellulose biosynthesis protein BcsQ